MAVSGFGGSGSGSIGISLSPSATFDTGLSGTATLSLDGTGGNTGDGCNGVVFTGTFEDVNVQVNGLGGGSVSSSNGHGVSLGLTSFSRGTAEIIGTGGPGSTTNHGVILTGDSVFTGSNNALTITGTAGAVSGNSVNGQLFLIAVDSLDVTTDVGQSSGGGVIFQATSVTATTASVTGVSFVDVGVGMSGLFDISSTFTVDGQSFVSLHHRVSAIYATRD